MPRPKITIKERVGKVYKITSPSGKIYIGSTYQKIDKRWNVYKNLSCKTQCKLYRSLKKYGPEAHVFEIIWEGPSENRFKLERFYGDLFEVLDRRKGLNLKLPGYEDVPAIYSEESKEKSSKSKKSKPGKISAKCHAASVEFRSLPVNSYNLEGKYLNTHKSMKQAYRDTGVNATQIRVCCVDEAWSAKGYQFRFYKNEDTSDIAPYVKNPNAKRKSVSVFDENWNHLRDFDSITNACTELGISDMIIYKSCKKGGRLTTVGLRFKLKDK